MLKFTLTLTVIILLLKLYQYQPLQIKTSYEENFVTLVASYSGLYKSTYKWYLDSTVYKWSDIIVSFQNIIYT